MNFWANLRYKRLLSGHRKNSIRESLSLNSLYSPNILWKSHPNWLQISSYLLIEVGHKIKMLCVCGLAVSIDSRPKTSEHKNVTNPTVNKTDLQTKLIYSHLISMPVICVAYFINWLGLCDTAHAEMNG